MVTFLSELLPLTTAFYSGPFSYTCLRHISVFLYLSLCSWFCLLIFSFSPSFSLFLTVSSPHPWPLIQCASRSLYLSVCHYFSLSLSLAHCFPQSFLFLSAYPLSLSIFSLTLDTLPLSFSLSLFRPTIHSHTSTLCLYLSFSRFSFRQLSPCAYLDGVEGMASDNLKQPTDSAASQLGRCSPQILSRHYSRF